MSLKEGPFVYENKKTVFFYAQPLKDFLKEK